MVKVYMVNVRNLPDPMEDPDIMKGLDAKRTEKIRCCKQQMKRKQSLGAGLLLKHIFKEYRLNMEEITCDENGKPEVNGIYFNLSHSGENVVCIGERTVANYEICSKPEERNNQPCYEVNLMFYIY